MTDGIINRATEARTDGPWMDRLWALQACLTSSFERSGHVTHMMMTTVIMMMIASYTNDDIKINISNTYKIIKITQINIRNTNNVGFHFRTFKTLRCCTFVLCETEPFLDNYFQSVWKIKFAHN